MKLANLKLSHRFALLIGAFLLAFVAYGALSFRTLNELKVNGPLYQRIVQSKDLVADILPPPEYIIESYLVSLQLAGASEAAERDRLTERLLKLKGEYDSRHEFWTKQGLERELQETFLERAHVPAASFYRVGLDELVPAVKAQNHGATAVALAKMERDYNAHRVAIDQVVQIANKRAETDEAQAGGQIRSAMLVMLALLLLSASVGIAGTAVLSLGISRRLKDAVRFAQSIAAGDLTRRARQDEGATRDELGQLMAALGHTTEQLASIVGRIKESSDMMGTASREIAQGNADLSTRTEEQASALEETSASMQQMTATVGQNAQNAMKANELAAQAAGVAAKGGEVVKEAVGTMNGITAASKKIADIIGVIDGIAFQTNILALNAAVEAARAGEQGRGFAVVASEVRSLAQRSAAAAKEIKDLITDSVSKVDAGSRQVNDAGRTMEEIVASVKKVTSLIAEITAASQEQAQGIEQVSETMTQLEKVTQQNAAMVEEASAAAGSLEDQSKALASAVAVFRLGEEAHSAQAPKPAIQQAAKPQTQAAVSQAPSAKKAVALPKRAAAGAKRPELHRPAPAKPVSAKKGNGHLEEGWQEF